MLEYAKGMSFGELALLHGDPRAATVTAPPFPGCLAALPAAVLRTMHSLRAFVDQYRRWRLTACCSDRR